MILSRYILTTYWHFYLAHSLDPSQLEYSALQEPAAL